MSSCDSFNERLVIVSWTFDPDLSRVGTVPNIRVIFLSLLRAEEQSRSGQYPDLFYLIFFTSCGVLPRTRRNVTDRQKRSVKGTCLSLLKPPSWDEVYLIFWKIRKIDFLTTPGEELPPIPLVSAAWQTMWMHSLAISERVSKSWKNIWYVILRLGWIKLVIHLSSNENKMELFIANRRLQSLHEKHSTNILCTLGMFLILQIGIPNNRLHQHFHEWMSEWYKQRGKSF